MAHDQEVVGPNPGTPYWTDVSDDASDDASDDTSYYIKIKLKLKVAKWGTPKQYKLKKNLLAK
jgi:hypothetical protein